MMNITAIRLIISSRVLHDFLRVAPGERGACGLIILDSYLPFM